MKTVQEVREALDSGNPTALLAFQKFLKEVTVDFKEAIEGEEERIDQNLAGFDHEGHLEEIFSFILADLMYQATLAIQEELEDE